MHPSSKRLHVNFNLREHTGQRNYKLLTFAVLNTNVKLRVPICPLVSFRGEDLASLRLRPTPDKIDRPED